MQSFCSIRMYRIQTHNSLTSTRALRYIRSKLRLHRSLIQKFSAWTQNDDATLTQSQLTEMLKELGVGDVAYAQVLAKQAFDSCRAVRPRVCVDVLDSSNLLDRNYFVFCGV